MKRFLSVFVVILMFVTICAPAHADSDAYIPSFNTDTITFYVNETALKIETGNEAFDRSLGPKYLDNAVVTLYRNNHEYGNARPINGRVTFTSLPAGTYYHHVSCAGYQPYTSSSFMLSYNSACEKDVLSWGIDLDKSNAQFWPPFKIKIVDRAGVPIKNEEVHVSIMCWNDPDTESSNSLQHTTDNNGYLTLWHGGDKDYYDLASFRLIRDNAYRICVGTEELMDEYYITPNGQSEYVCILTNGEAVDLCATYLQHIDMQYPKIALVFDDKSYPPVPKQNEKDFAAELESWAKILGYDDDLRGANYKSLLDYKIYWPAKDARNGQLLFVDDNGGSTVESTMAYIAFMMSLREGYVDPLDEELASFQGSDADYIAHKRTITKYVERYAVLQDRFGGDYRSTFTHLVALDVARTSLKHILKNELNISIPSELYDIPKTLLDTNSSENASLLDKLSWYAAFGDAGKFNDGVRDGMNFYRTYAKDLPGYLWKVKSKGIKSATFEIAFDSTVEWLSDSEETWISTAGNTLGNATTTVKLLKTALEGSFLGTLALAAHLSNVFIESLIGFIEDIEDSQAGWYFLVSDYLRSNYPQKYKRIVNEVTLEPYIYGSGNNSIECLSRASSTMADTGDPVADTLIRKFRSCNENGWAGSKPYELPNANGLSKLLAASFMLSDCRSVDYVSMIDSLLKTIVDQYKYNNTKYYRMTIACPVTVNIYDANRNQVHSISSQNGVNQQTFDQYGSYYLAGDSSEIKQISLFDQGYWAEIIPYGDGAMDVTISEDIGDTTIASESYSNVSITRGQRFALNNSVGDLPALYVIDENDQAIHSIAADGGGDLYTVLVNDNGNRYSQLSTSKVFQGIGTYQFKTNVAAYVHGKILMPDSDGVYSVSVNRDIAIDLIRAVDAADAGVPNTGDSSPILGLVLIILGAGILLLALRKRRRNE